MPLNDFGGPADPKEVTQAPADMIMDSISIDGVWRHPLAPIQVDSGQFVYVMGDKLYISYPHVCAPADGAFVAVLALACLAFGVVCGWFVPKLLK